MPRTLHNKGVHIAAAQDKDSPPPGHGRRAQRLLEDSPEWLYSATLSCWAWLSGRPRACSCAPPPGTKSQHTSSYKTPRLLTVIWEFLGAGEDQETVELRQRLDKLAVERPAG